MRLPRNVSYDTASPIKWSDLNETSFLERVFTALEARMGLAFRAFSFFILSAPGGAPDPASASHPSERKVLVSISDESGSVPLHLVSRYVAIFKAYLPRELPGSGIFPFTPGYVGEVTTYPVLPLLDRRVSVFFNGNLNSNRLSLYRALHPVYRRLPRPAFRVALSLASRGMRSCLMPSDLSHALPQADLRFTDGFKRGIPPTEYGRRLAESRIVLCPRGWQSSETFRHMEAMRAGAVVVSERLPDTWFYRGSPIITVEDWDAGVRRVRELLADEDELAARHRQTVDWWRSVCSEEAVASYMSERILENTRAPDRPA